MSYSKDTPLTSQYDWWNITRALIAAQLLLLLQGQNCLRCLEDGLCSEEKEKHWVDNWSMDKYDKGANNADNSDSNDDDVKHDAEELEV